jgi:nucleotide-binding universal stress UspA family protein
VIVGAGHEWGLERRLFGLAPELMVERCPISLLLVRQYDARPVSAGGAPA